MLLPKTSNTERSAAALPNTITTADDVVKDVILFEGLPQAQRHIRDKRPLRRRECRCAWFTDMDVVGVTRLYKSIVDRVDALRVSAALVDE